MAPKGEQAPPLYYSPVPPPPPPLSNPNFFSPDQDQDQYYVLLPLYRPRRSFCRVKRCLLCLVSLVLLALLIFLLYPSDPQLKVVRLRLNHIAVRTQAFVSLDISLALTIQVRNPDFFSLDYRSLFVSIGYRGRELGIVRSSDGHLAARGSSYVEATLTLDGVEVLHDLFYLLEDLAKGVIPFDAFTKVRGDLGVLFFDVPIKAEVSCEVYVNTNNQTIVRQDCYPE